MSIDSLLSGSLFARDFLVALADPTADESHALPQWEALDDQVDHLHEELSNLFDRFPVTGTPNESQTEDDLIWPVLECLGWTASLRQQTLSATGQGEVPDGLLFTDDAAKDRAVGVQDGHLRYAIGKAMVESKRWRLALDRSAGAITAPSTQMLRYLRHADDLTTGQLRWGILTNGALWRLYFQGARSVSEGYFEVNLAAVLGMEASGEAQLFPTSPSDEDRRHALKLFAFLFQRRAFLAEGPDGQSLHQRLLGQSHLFEERVATDISNTVLDNLYPGLVHAIAERAPKRSNEEIRDASLIFLYRLLFLLYAEDRALLPVHDSRYVAVSLRDRLRGPIKQRKEHGEAFSGQTTTYYTMLEDLCRVVDKGEPAFGLPPYNGGLFDENRVPLLSEVRLPDNLMADVIDALAFERVGETRRYINYRSLSVQQLGTIYERLIELEVVRNADGATVRHNVFARKDAGGYYTPESLVGLILNETLGPLVEDRTKAFHEAAQKACPDPSVESVSEDDLARLHEVDSAAALLDLKVCDPAMGSGHFLVSLVDYLSDRVIAAIGEAQGLVPGYVSPVTGSIRTIRETILARAKSEGWTVDAGQLDDRQIVRRMVLKRCIYGVDKNPMAVELAKVSLWLHTFTVGAPLSFLDHHLRCGDSLFGYWVDEGRCAATQGGMFLSGPLKLAAEAAQPMQQIEALSDAELSEAVRSAELWRDVQAGTTPLAEFLSLLRAFEWLAPIEAKRRKAKQAKAQQGLIASWLTGIYGDPVAIAAGQTPVDETIADSDAFSDLLASAREIVGDERFLHWQVAFPGVWQDWDDKDRAGGFDAMIGNPPWDRMRLEQVEWFALRRPEIAQATRAADRRRMMRELEEKGDLLAADFRRAFDRVGAAMRTARVGKQYPLLSGGDINLYSLFVERALTLVKPEGVIGLLTPSGIASDRNAARFFRSVATTGRLRTLYDFENRRTRFDTDSQKAPPFFPHVDTRFKFCAFVAGRSASEAPASCAFFLQDASELEYDDRRFALMPEDFAQVNPNTGTAPVLLSRRDADLATGVYRRVPVLVNRAPGEPVATWPVRYNTRFHMTNDSDRFRRRAQLEEEEGAWPVAGNCFDSPTGVWLPLQEGKTVQAFDHRAASVVVNPRNLRRPAQPRPATPEQHSDPAWLPHPQYWVNAAENSLRPADWQLAFKDVTAPTNIRSMIAAIVPTAAAGNTLPLLVPEDGWAPEQSDAPLDEKPRASLLLANLNAIMFDYLARQKVHGQHLNWYIVEQIPVIPQELCASTYFGPRAATDIIREAVLELTYTSHDLAPFAEHLGHVDDAGDALPPFPWNPDRRRRLMAKLDAVFFHLYGITNRNDIRHIYSTFPILERREKAAHGNYRPRDLSLAYTNALAAGKTGDVTPRAGSLSDLATGLWREDVSPSLRGFVGVLGV